MRSADDKIMGDPEHRLRDERSPGLRDCGVWRFFTHGKESIVVPIRSLKVSQERGTFFLPITMAVVKAVPLMPDQDYTWLSNQAWRTRNDALFVPK